MGKKKTLIYSDNVEDAKKLRWEEGLTDDVPNKCLKRLVGPWVPDEKRQKKKDKER